MENFHLSGDSVRTCCISFGNFMRERHGLRGVHREHCHKLAYVRVCVDDRLGRNRRRKGDYPPRGGKVLPGVTPFGDVDSSDR